MQKYGIGLRQIDAEALAARRIKLLTLRRRANIACAEHAIGLMLAQAKMTTRLAGRISVETLAEAGYRYQPFDRRRQEWSLPALDAVADVAGPLRFLGVAPRRVGEERGVRNARW